MRNLKKFVALLLAGAMVLLLFTACGGSGSGTDAQAEAQYMKAVNANRSATQSLNNDNTELKEYAKKMIGTAVDINTGEFNGSTRFDMKSDWEETIITVVSKCTYSNEDLNKFLGSISFENKNVDVKYAGLWTDVGVVVKTIKGQTYIAVSVKMANPLVKK